MSLAKRYNPKTAEPGLQDNWQTQAVYQFDPSSTAPVFSIDTPPPTVSGHLHLGHVYSFSHTDFIARFWRMNGRNVFYPMGYDDNGLPTERLVERREGIRGGEIEQQAFIAKCLAISEEAEKEYRGLWQRLGLSIDWRYSYRTIAENSQRIAQWSFLDLQRKGLAYRQKAPAIWCPECQTAIAQADVNDLERDSIFYTLAFQLPDGSSLPIATTRPELLPACVAIFVHPDDGRYQHYLGQQITIPLFGRQVPLLADAGADPAKGTGAVMCCTFGDTADVEWWRSHDLPLIEAIGADGRLTNAAEPFNGLSLKEGRQAIVAALAEQEQLLAQEAIQQTIRVHERCDTAVEFIVTPQWFVRLLDYKDEFLAAADQMVWQPAHMKNRYRQWVENLGWDWCISRQRTFGVPIPVWTCAACGETILPEEADLPVNPMLQRPLRPCPACQSTEFFPETDVFDTWFTSSMSPQIVGQWQSDDDLYEQLYPFDMRPQAHEIIRTWAFYTIVKSWHHFGKIPFKNVAVSGWGLAPEGTEKLSKSRGGGAINPLEMIEQHSADAVRYWAASTAVGKDALISEEKIQAGAKLVNKLWNVARFSQRFLSEAVVARHAVGARRALPLLGTLADRWLLAQTAQLVAQATRHFEQYDYASAKNVTEQFFWRVLADNYLEMAKLRLYEGGAAAEGAQYALSQALLTTLKLFAPILPHITERIYQGLFAEMDGSSSIHRANWPQVQAAWLDAEVLEAGEILVDIATAVRRYKSEHNLALGAELAAITILTEDAALAKLLSSSQTDLQSITRAQEIIVNGRAPQDCLQLPSNESIHIWLRPFAT